MTSQSHGRAVSGTSGAWFSVGKRSSRGHRLRASKTHKRSSLKRGQKSTFARSGGITVATHIVHFGNATWYTQRENGFTVSIAKVYMILSSFMFMGSSYEDYPTLNYAPFWI